MPIVHGAVNISKGEYKGKKDYGIVPISTGEASYLRHVDAMARRKARLIQVRQQERSFAKKVREKYSKRRANVLKNTRLKTKSIYQCNLEKGLTEMHAKYRACLKALGTAHELAQHHHEDLAVKADKEKSLWDDKITIERDRMAAALCDKREKENRGAYRTQLQQAKARETVRLLESQRQRSKAHEYGVTHVEEEEIETTSGAEPVANFDKSRFHQTVAIKKESGATVQEQYDATAAAAMHTLQQQKRAAAKMKQVEYFNNAASRRGENALHKLKGIQHSASLEAGLKRLAHADRQRHAQTDHKGAEKERWQDIVYRRTQSVRTQSDPIETAFETMFLDPSSLGFQVCGTSSQPQRSRVGYGISEDNFIDAECDVNSISDTMEYREEKLKSEDEWAHYGTVDSSAEVHEYSKLPRSVFHSESPSDNTEQSQTAELSGVYQSQMDYKSTDNDRAFISTRDDEILTSDNLAKCESDSDVEQRDFESNRPETVMDNATISSRYEYDSPYSRRSVERTEDLMSVDATSTKEISDDEGGVLEGFQSHEISSKKDDDDSNMSSMPNHSPEKRPLPAQSDSRILDAAVATLSGEGRAASNDSCESLETIDEKQSGNREVLSPPEAFTLVRSPLYTSAYYDASGSVKVVHNTGSDSADSDVSEMQEEHLYRLGQVVLSDLRAANQNLTFDNLNDPSSSTSLVGSILSVAEGGVHSISTLSSSSSEDDSSRNSGNSNDLIDEDIRSTLERVKRLLSKSESSPIERIDLPRTGGEGMNNLEFGSLIPRTGRQEENIAVDRRFLAQGSDHILSPRVHDDTRSAPAIRYSEKDDDLPRTGDEGMSNLEFGYFIPRTGRREENIAVDRRFRAQGSDHTLLEHKNVAKSGTLSPRVQNIAFRDEKRSAPAAIRDSEEDDDITFTNPRQISVSDKTREQHDQDSDAPYKEDIELPKGNSQSEKESSAPRGSTSQKPLNVATSDGDAEIWESLQSPDANFRTSLISASEHECDTRPLYPDSAFKEDSESDAELSDGDCTFITQSSLPKQSVKSADMTPTPMPVGREHGDLDSRSQDQAYDTVIQPRTYQQPSRSTDNSRESDVSYTGRSEFSDGDRTSSPPKKSVESVAEGISFERGDHDRHSHITDNSRESGLSSADSLSGSGSSSGRSEMSSSLSQSPRYERRDEFSSTWASAYAGPIAPMQLPPMPLPVPHDLSRAPEPLLFSSSESSYYTNENDSEESKEISSSASSTSTSNTVLQRIAEKKRSLQSDIHRLRSSSPPKSAIGGISMEESQGDNRDISGKPISWSISSDFQAIPNQPQPSLADVFEQRKQSFIDRSRARQESIHTKPPAPKVTKAKAKRENSRPAPSALLGRLSQGQRAQISQREMRQRTQRMYRRLPEVKEQESLRAEREARRERLKRARELDKARRRRLRR